jgi:putative tryptophan/tyrosine transport system substrate-binding protein
MRFDHNRRDFLTLLGAAAAWPLAARAQQQPKMPRVGFVGIQPREAPVYTNFLKRMAELGYQEGRNFAFDYIQTPDVEGYERNYSAIPTDEATPGGNDSLYCFNFLTQRGSPGCI